MTEYQHWQIVTDNEQIQWLTLDRHGESVNSLSREVLAELDCILDNIDQQAVRGMVITSGKKTGFIAGADVKQFSSLATEDEAFDLIREGQLVFDKLAALSIPTVALINGFCMGGGYELALACRFRVALDAPQVKIGLPEIKLGIQPGWGGTVRLPKLIGGMKAMSIILPGAAVSAMRAKKMGMVDAAVPERQLHRAARHFVLTQSGGYQSTWFEQATNWYPMRVLLARVMRHQLAKKHVNQAHYPAPFAVIDCWQRDCGSAEAMVNEAKSIASLMTTPTARNLLNVFFMQGKMKELARGVKTRFRHVHVIGAGIMGGDIAAWCALKGCQVTLQDQSPERIAPAMQRAHRLFKKKLKKPRLISEALDRLQPDLNGRGVKGADVIIEAVFENLEVKQQIFSQVEKEAKATAILATNTSSIPLESIAAVMSDPARLVGIHFFNPVAMMQLVEIVRTPATDTQLIAETAAFVKQIGRLPLPVLSKPGFLVNRVLMAYLTEAMRLYEEGVSKEVIDRAATKFGMPMGPIALADKVGLDICLSVASNLTEHFGGSVSAKLQDMVKQGNLGVKSGSGFYEYGKKSSSRLSKVCHSLRGFCRSFYRVRPVADDASDVTSRMMMRMLNEAIACYAEGVVDDTTLLNAGMIFGTGFSPFTGGPIQYAEDEGISAVVTQLTVLAERYGDRFKPNAGWELLGTSREESAQQVVLET